MTKVVLTVTQERRLRVATELAAGMLANPARMPAPDEKQRWAVIEALVNVSYEIADAMIARAAKEDTPS